MEDGELVDTCIRYWKNDNSSDVLRVTKTIFDHRDERRNACKTVYLDEYDSFADALEEAKKQRAFLEQRKTDLEWLREKYPEPKNKNIAAKAGAVPPDSEAAAYSPSDEVQSNPYHGMTFSQFMEAGLQKTEDSHWEVDPDTDQTGYLHRIKTRNSNSGDWPKKKSAYQYALKWGKLNNLRLDEIGSRHLKQLTKFLENQERLSSKKTIDDYRKVIRYAVGEWARNAGVRSPVEGGFEIPKHKIDANAETEKVHSVQDVHDLHKKMIRRVGEARSHHVANRVTGLFAFRFLIFTGLRPEEVLYLQRKHLELRSEQPTAKVEGAVSRDGAGGLKTERLSGMKGRNQRKIPIAKPLAGYLEWWIENREIYGLPTIDECPIIFCHEDGKWWHDNRLRRPFTQAHDTFRPSHCRHTVLSRLAELGVPRSIRNALTGHQTGDIDSHYVSVQAEGARNDLDRLWDPQNTR